jgi:IS4 transposase
LAGILSKLRYPEPLRCVTFIDVETGKTFEFLTNNFALPAITICALYKQQWQVELFFKWIKQHLRIKAFYGNTENAVKTQIWVAILTYVSIAIMKKRLNLKHSLYEILRVLDLNMFEMTSIETLLGRPVEPTELSDYPIQQDLFQTLGH